MVERVLAELKDILYIPNKTSFGKRMDSKTIIDALGGPSEVARLCDLTPQAVSQWYGRDADGKERQIPKSWRRYLELAKPLEFARLHAQYEQKAA
jgi:hypothetical protein